MSAKFIFFYFTDTDTFEDTCDFLKMARRLLTRIELRMEDLQEYEIVKKQQEKKKNGAENSESLNVFGRPEESISNFKSNIW